MELAAIAQRNGWITGDPIVIPKQFSRTIGAA